MQIRNKLKIAEMLLNVIGTLAALAMVVVGVYEKDYAMAHVGLLFAFYFKLDSINSKLKGIKT